MHFTRQQQVGWDFAVSRTDRESEGLDDGRNRRLSQVGLLEPAKAENGSAEAPGTRSWDARWQDAPSNAREQQRIWIERMEH